MHAAVDGGDPVGEGVDALVEPGVPLQGDLHLHGLLPLLQRADLPEEGLLGGIEVTDVVDDAVLVLVRLGRLALGSLVGEPDLEALVEEGHHLQPFHHRLGPELDLLEDGRVRPERDGGPGAATGSPSGDLQLPGRFSAVDELQNMVVTATVDLQEEPGGQGVHHRDAHAVQATGDLVAAPLTELATGVEHGEHHLGRRLSPLLLHRAGRDTPAVVDDLHPSVGQQGDVDLRAVAGHGLVDGIVDDLPHQVVETGGAGRADVHPGPFPDRVQPLQNGDVLGAVAAAVLFFQRHGRALSNID